MNNREIKFRAWITNLNKFVYGITIYPSGGTAFFHPETGYNVDIDNKFVQQFTSLKDKNGKEIYEGDIVKYKRRGGVVADEKEYISTVEWDNKFVCFKLGEHFGFERVLGFTMEIVGNIFENPDLLK